MGKIRLEKRKKIMKININDLKFTPSKMEFDLCVYGTPNPEIADWIAYHKLQTYQSGSYTNISIPEGFNISEAFCDFKTYDYLDGFSPNLNKHLHVGHLSNFIYAKTFQKMKICKKYIAVFGDTLTGDVKKDDALETYWKTIKLFDYKIDKAFYASELKLLDFSLLHGGSGEYKTTKIIDVDGDKIVAIKSDGSTTYFYQDVAVAQKLNAPTLYLTGFEQNNHFAKLKKIFPHTDHIGLGLVMLDGKKMSSSENNIIFLQDIINQMMPLYNDDLKLVWNILSGMILKTEPSSVKSLDTKVVNNPKISPGLYVSYTMAKMNSAGIDLVPNDVYANIELEFKSLKSKVSLKPNFLLDAIVNQCKIINQYYETYQIKGNSTNQKMFQSFVGDLIKATQEIGMFEITKV